ncbi:MAG TPA: MFS transporter [Bacteroidales bacterium]|nr:MFS transporter [Bacteroidales bacterium]
MESETIKVYGYRWVILAAFMLAVVANQMMWITFAPVTITASAFYHVSDLSIGLLSMVFMVVYIFISMPASWVIDSWGFRASVMTGALLTGGFGLLRGLLAKSFTWVLVSQIGIAIGQPFILNAITMVAARWFPLKERGTAAGLGSLAMYLGIILGMVVTPVLVAGSGMEWMLLYYGILAMLAAVVFIVLAREHPPTPASPPGHEERSGILEGLRVILKKKNYLILMLIFFIGLGIFNAVATWIEDIVRPRGFTPAQAGMAGGLMILGGLVGAVIMSWLSDHYRRRIPFILIALGAAAVGLAGLTFSTGYLMLLISSFVIGFFLLSAGPVGFQYGAEIAYPAPEGTSNGILLLMGQISGILFIIGMDTFKVPGTGSMTPSLLVLVALMIVSLLLATRLKESQLLSGNREKEIS